jgi:phytoene desaturase
VPAIYAALVYLQIVDGGWYAEGGTYSLVEAMARPLHVRCGARVERIERSGEQRTRGGRGGASRVTGVRLAGGERIGADVVVSNADVLSTHTLLGRRPPVRPLRATMSCYLLFLGVDGRQPDLLHHTLLLGRDYRDTVAAVTRGRALPRELSTYLHVPSRTEPAMAAAGGESLYSLLPVSNLSASIDWRAEERPLRDRLLADYEESFGLTGLRDSIRVEHSMTPEDFRAVLGNAFAVEPTLHQSAYFRQPNRDRSVTGLYCVGGGTHPGAGVPGVLLGAEVTANLIAGDHANRRTALAA